MNIQNQYKAENEIISKNTPDIAGEKTNIYEKEKTIVLNNEIQDNKKYIEKIEREIKMLEKDSDEMISEIKYYKAKIKNNMDKVDENISIEDNISILEGKYYKKEKELSKLKNRLYIVNDLLEKRKKGINLENENDSIVEAKSPKESIESLRSELINVVFQKKCEGFIPNAEKEKIYLKGLEKIAEENSIILRPRTNNSKEFDSNNYYEILGIELKDIESINKERIKECLIKRNSEILNSKDSNLSEELKELMYAYKVLIDDKTRKEYNEHIINQKPEKTEGRMSI